MPTETWPFQAERKSLRSVYDRDILGTNIAPTSLDSSVAAWAEAEWIPKDGPFAFLLNRHFASSIETTAFGLLTRHRVFEHAPIFLHSFLTLSEFSDAQTLPNSSLNSSTLSNFTFQHSTSFCPVIPLLGSVLSNIVMPWIDDDGAATDSCVLGPSVEGGMPKRLVAHLKNNLVDLSAFDGEDFQDWNVARPQPQWPTSTPDWEKWLPRMVHFFGQQWKEQGIYHLIKLFDRPLFMDRSLLVMALCFWSSATNTMNLRFGMMTSTVLDVAALFGLSPLGVEVNAALVAPEAEGIRRRTCSTTPASTATSAWRTSSMMIPLLPWARSSMPRSCCTGYASSCFAPRRTKSPGAWPIPPWSYLPYASRRHHGWDEAEARWATTGIPVLAVSLLPRAEGDGQYC
ncbi:unnamed protein product [Prunus brigantina]